MLKNRPKYRTNFCPKTFLLKESCVLLTNVWSKNIFDHEDFAHECFRLKKLYLKIFLLNKIAQFFFAKKLSNFSLLKKLPNFFVQKIVQKFFCSIKIARQDNVSEEQTVNTKKTFY